MPSGYEFSLKAYFLERLGKLYRLIQVFLPGDIGKKKRSGPDSGLKSAACERDFVWHPVEALTVGTVALTSLSISYPSFWASFSRGTLKELSY